MKNNESQKSKISRRGMHQLNSFMKKHFLWIAVIVLLSSFTLYRAISYRNTFLMDRLIGALDALHYSPVAINDQFSEDVFNLYIKRIDGGKKFLLQSDVDAMAKYRRSIDDEIMSAEGRFELYNMSVEIINKRIKEKESWYKELLSKPFNYSVEEEYETDPEKLAFAADETTQKEEWRKMLKYRVISRIDDALNRQEKAKEKNDTTIKILSFDSLEVDARRKELKVHDDWFKRLNKRSERERFADYLNAITSIYDPHTEYFAPKDKKKFDEAMSGQFEGIGARLQQKDGFIKITEIVPGSPSYKQGELKAGDEIHKVKQENEKQPVDVTTWDIDDAIQLIKGKKGTKVTLTVKKPDGSFKDITITRDIVETEETYAKSAILNNNKKKIGYIYLPTFYADFTKNGAHKCATDMRKEIEKLKAQGIEGLIVDLRDNGGGSLQEVVEMAGLFINKGPVVQVKAKNDATGVMEDYNPDIAWTGPLSIMVNHGSASASEILAAAMQDYKRAVIVGTPTFGKGTVQSFASLDQNLLPQLDSLKPLGDVKITMQKFYRINGGATQLKGVTPDVILPDPYEYFDDIGEKDMEHPMKWDEIAKANYVPFTYIDYDKVKRSSDTRVKANPTFKLIETEAKELKSKKDDTKYNLALEKYRAEQKVWRDQNKKYENLKKEIKDFTAELLKVDTERMGSDTTRLGRENRWAKNLSKDIYVHEASNILSEFKSGDVATANPK
jgi:carboxyl-terminal processing protease